MVINLFYFVQIYEVREDIPNPHYVPPSARKGQGEGQGDGTMETGEETATNDNTEGGLESESSKNGQPTEQDTAS
jgi:hypothetical protein